MPKLTRRTALGTAAALPVALTAPPLLAAPALLPEAEPIADRPLFGASHWTLPNGLRVVLAESRRVPVVAHYLFYGAGGGEDPAGRSGLAHFLEHMMFKGSRNVAPGALSLAVAREGGQDNAFTSRDVTAYHQHIEASRLPLVMRLEADRFAAPLLPADQVEPERAVVLEERRLRTDSNPRSRFWEAMEAALWGAQHWHGRPIIGWEDEIRALSLEDLHAFYAHRYAPANAVLVLAGDVREAEARRLVDEFYAPVEARPVTPRDRAPPPAGPTLPRFALNDARVQEASLVRSFFAPGLLFGEVRHAYPLEVLAHLLGSGPGSRLQRALVQTGLATSAGCSYDSETPGATSLTVTATARQGTPPERLEAALDAVLDRLLQEPPAEAEVQRSIRQLTRGAVLALDGIGAAPRMLGGTLAVGLPLDAVEYWPARLRAVTVPQVAEAAKAVLGAAPRLTAWLLPEGVAAPRGGAPA